MINKIILFGLTVATGAAFAGVGGIAGGHSTSSVDGSIHFQKESTWVNPLYSQTLCHDHRNYEVVVPKCVRWSSGSNPQCLSRKKVKIFQPISSEQTVCTDSSDEGSCRKWVKQGFVQPPERRVAVTDDDGRIVEVHQVVVPTCR